MNLTQSDVAQIDDDTLKQLAVSFNELAGATADRPLAGFWQAIAAQIVGLVRGRRLTMLAAESDLLNVHEEGAIVGPDDDPIDEALRELRGEVR